MMRKSLQVKPWGRAFQVMGAARAKALRQEQAWWFGGTERRLMGFRRIDPG